MNNELIIYTLLSFLLLFLFAKISYKLNLVDLPNKRKIHNKNIAYTGGIAISFILVLSILLLDISDNNLNNILSIAFLISIIGLVDDKYNLNVGGKLSLQIIPIFYLIIFENLNLNQLGDYNYFKLELGTFKIPFTLICVLFLINSFNYFDGLDGALSFTTISVLAILYFLTSDQNIHLFLIIILIPIIIFLFFNFSFLKLPKMFLGDSGSLLIGFIISFVLIYFVNQNLTHPILLAWSITIFVYEFLSINLIRLKDKRNLFKAGQDHIHHVLFKKTKSVFLTNFFITLTNIILFIIGYLSFILISPLASLILFISLFIIFLVLRNKYQII
jgi:UDP-GlcNAc:undecaprenyl-phosphate GlcNAc-1-phosphate transferase|tara:strand:+ start:246 stop:1238 length:993 start_codon:yes stop_codon:yes gene_type:complete